MYPCGLPFDKSSRANKLLEVLNCSKSSFGCSKFNFQINGADYCIERVGKTSPKRGTTKADVNFLCIVDGATAATHSLNGEEFIDANSKSESMFPHSDNGDLRLCTGSPLRSRTSRARASPATTTGIHRGLRPHTVARRNALLASLVAKKMPVSNMAIGVVCLGVSREFPG